MNESSWDNPKTTKLCEAILALRNRREAKNFFRDLLTEQEILEFAKRWQAARMLAQKKSYTRIERATGLSSRTIARVARWLNQGRGGYKLMIRRLYGVHCHSSSGGKGLR